jgi:hypothetical protein
MAPRSSDYGIKYDRDGHVWRIDTWDGWLTDQHGRLLGWSSWDSAAEAHYLLGEGRPIQADYIDASATTTPVLGRAS